MAMHRNLFRAALVHFLWLGIAVAQPSSGTAPFVELLEDDVEALLPQLRKNEGNPEPSEVSRELRDVFSGVCSVRATSLQRYTTQVQGWAFTIAQNPQPGEYRFLRFAWKRIEGAAIMFQLHANGHWYRYYAGQPTAVVKNWGPMTEVAAKVPRDWQVVTRDLFQDFGAITLSGIAFSPLEGPGTGFFDHIYLGRTIKDLDQATAVVLGTTPLKDTLSARELDKLWSDLASADVRIAGGAVRKLTAGRKDSIAFLKERLERKPQPIDGKRVATLIVALDDDDYDVRENASKDLRRLGEGVVKTLKEARVAAKSAEQRERLDELLRSEFVDNSGLTSNQLRTLRVIRIL
jgi:hypothetical protein